MAELTKEAVQDGEEKRHQGNRTQSLAVHISLKSLLRPRRLRHQKAAAETIKRKYSQEE